MYCGIYIYPPQQSLGKVIFSQASVILSTVGGGCLVPGGCLVLGDTWSWECLLQGCLVPGGYLVWGVPGSRGVPCPEGVPGPGGCLVETPQDGYYCGQYTSYWKAFLFRCAFSNLPEKIFIV